MTRFTIHVCEQCLSLTGEMCHNPYCLFCRRTMTEVGEYLDALLIRPLIDGERIVGDEGEPVESAQSVEHASVSAAAVGPFHQEAEHFVRMANARLTAIQDELGEGIKGMRVLADILGAINCKLGSQQAAAWADRMAEYVEDSPEQPGPNAVLREMQHGLRTDCDAEGWHLCTPKKKTGARADASQEAQR